MLRKVLHIGIEVANSEEAISFYEKLGYEKVKQFDKPEPKAKVAHVQKGDNCFELWQFLDKIHPRVAYIRHHVAILSDDLESDVDDLVKQGYKLVIPVTEGVTMSYAFIQDQAGINYEIAAKLS